MSINIGLVISNAHAAQNLTHVAIMRDMRHVRAAGLALDDGEMESVDDDLVKGLKKSNPWRMGISSLLSFIVGVFLVLYVSWAEKQIAALPQLYKPQIELSKRQYYPAILVDKYENETCNKSGSRCTSTYTFVIKLENAKYKHITMTKDSYLTHQPGSTINLERHITDPAQHKLVEEQRWKYKIIFASVFGYLLTAFGTLCGSYFLIRHYVFPDSPATE